MKSVSKHLQEALEVKINSTVQTIIRRHQELSSIDANNRINHYCIQIILQTDK